MILKKIVDGLIWENQGKFCFAAGKIEAGKREGRFMPLNLSLIKKEKQERREIG